MAGASVIMYTTLSVDISLRHRGIGACCRRPSAVDSDARQHPPKLPHPAEHKDLKREVILRHSPELVLPEPQEQA